jgi:hypothetical protein
MIHIYVSAYIYLNYVSNREKNYVHPKFQNLMDFDWLMKLPVWVNCISERGYRTRTPKSNQRYHCKCCPLSQILEWCSLSYYSCLV